MQLTRARKILTLALPIIGGMCSQNVLNAVDTAFVGQLGKVALGAVGIGGISSWLGLSSLIGLSTAAQAYAARRVGERQDARAAVGLHGALLLGVAGGVTIAVAAWLGADQLLAIMSDDPEVRRDGAQYLRVRMCAAPFAVATFAFHGFWNGVGQSKRYMFVLLVMHATNALLDWVLIFGHWGAPALGSTGAALATAVSQAVGLAVYVMMALRAGGPWGMLKTRPTRTDMGALLKVAVPTSLQQMSFSAGFVAFFGVAGILGTEAVALSHVLVNLMLLCILPAVGFGIAGATLVGQSLGRGDKAEALAWGRDVVLLGVAVMTLVGLTLALERRWCLSLFLSEEPSLIELGSSPLLLLGLIQSIDAAGVMFKQIMLRCGDTLAVFKISASLQWLVFLPSLWFACAQMHGGVTTLWALLVAWRLLDTAAMSARWFRGRWTESAVI